MFLTHIILCLYNNLGSLTKILIISSVFNSYPTLFNITNTNTLYFKRSPKWNISIWDFFQLENQRKDYFIVN